MPNDDISCKQHKYGMLESLSIKASEVHNTRAIQYNAQWTKLTLNRLHACQDSGKMAENDGSTRIEMKLMQRSKNEANKHDSQMHLKSEKYGNMACM